MIESIQALFENSSFSYAQFRLLISTALLVLFIVVLRLLSRRYILNSVASRELRRKWIVQSRNGLIILFLLGMILIWGDELRTLAISVVAIAVALVIATKELISCITGSILKSGASSFDIGDRIQVKEFRGDVIDQNLLATTILEVGPGKLTQQRTGRITIIPNALFLSEPVVNESFTHEYILHVFTVPFKREDNWKAAQVAMQASAEKICAPYLEDARTFMEKLSDRRGLDIPSVDPRVSISTPAAGEIHLIVRVPAKTSQRSFVEQAILSEVFDSHDFTKKE
ncbi:MAG: mechanosensitive ion channel [Bacteroidetes bacterium]|jgi:small-conductance mechanosensitive channel|nr:mechanosensitive ion channel [Bacteroidota bacterium]